MKKTIFGLIATLTMPATMLAWGQKGHDVTAAIAERHLSPAAKAMADSLLDGCSLVYWANWLDNASHTPELNYSKTWHYKNINADQSYETAPQHQAGDIVTALRRNLAILQNSKATKDEKALALKMVIHLSGDIHQPMHLGHATDLGGNWAKDTYLICSEVYDKTPKGTVISYDYIANWTPTVEQQFLKGGLRLARLLNTVLDPKSEKTKF